MVVVAALSVIADLGSKYWAFETLGPDPVRITREQVLQADDLRRLIPSPPRKVVVPGVLELTLVLNPGAVFGIGAGARWFFIFFTIGAVGFVTWMFCRWTSSRDWFAHVSAGLLIGGGLGNLYDRIVFACVRDFLHPLPTARVGGRALWPYVSNVADALLLVGILGLLIFSWKKPTPRKPGKKDTPTRAEA